MRPVFFFFLLLLKEVFFFINLWCTLLADNLSEALKTLKLSSADSASDSVESCLDCMLKALAHNSKCVTPYITAIFYYSLVFNHVFSI